MANDDGTTHLGRVSKLFSETLRERNILTIPTLTYDAEKKRFCATLGGTEKLELDPTRSDSELRSAIEAAAVKGYPLSTPRLRPPKMTM